MFLRTLREDPADADTDSAKLLLRAGYVRKAAPGIWTWLPLGLKVLNKIEAIVREEIDGIGARRSTSRRCCRASRMRPPTAGRNTARTCSV